MSEINPLEAMAPSNLPAHLRSHLASANEASLRNIDRARSSPAKAAQLKKSQQGLADLLSSPAPFL
ncbi:hypothetical protein LC612_42920, partial [Nostoc sp. CHAB 5834]|nr:hypothetical protein [Nostoc sp. CHAB 5834]